MNTLAHKLQECTSIDQAEPILRQLKAGPAVRKLTETAMLLKNHPDKTQQQYGVSFLNSVIQEMDAEEEPTPHHGDAVKAKDEHFVKEEELAGGNKDGTEGSEQSTDNTAPYTQVADDSESGQKDMEKMEGTENQFNENIGQSPMGMFPQIEPGVATEMGGQMPPMPPMNTNQMMRQMQYTVAEALRKYVVPLRTQIRQQQEAIKFLSNQIKETQAKTGSMKLDIATVKQNAPARNAIQETTTPITPGMIPENQIHKRTFELEKARHDINEMDNLLRGNNQSPYL